MKLNINIKKKLADQWFNFLQSEIVNACQSIERKSGSKAVFKKKIWSKLKVSEGGGTSMILKNGKIFEKVGVNKSTVSGSFKKKFRPQIKGAVKSKGAYWASGVSFVAHMLNPKVPAIHFNTRFIVTADHWFGGGIDATPAINDKKEEKLIHSLLKQVCTNNKKNYKKLKKYCDEYFFLPHRNERRGIGGIFFDYEDKNWEKDFKFVREVGLVLISILETVINRKAKSKWNKNDKLQQLYKRGRYVEFNLLYDRGTKFGLNSGGNIDSIFMSLPPQAKWN